MIMVAAKVAQIKGQGFDFETDKPIVCLSQAALLARLYGLKGSEIVTIRIQVYLLWVMLSRLQLVPDFQKINQHLLSWGMAVFKCAAWKS